MDMQTFVDQYMYNCADYPRAARWHGTKRTQAGKDNARRFLAMKLYKRLEVKNQLSSNPAPNPAPAPSTAGINPNKKQNENHSSNGGGYGTQYQTAIAKQAALVCGCAGCRHKLGKL